MAVHSESLHPENLQEDGDWSLQSQQVCRNSEVESALDHNVDRAILMPRCVDKATAEELKPQPKFRDDSVVCLLYDTQATRDHFELESQKQGSLSKFGRLELRRSECRSDHLTMCG